MTNDARTEANRRNAKKSTGPRSRAGKERSARNSFRHGLAVAIRSLPGAGEHIEALARKIVEGDQRPAVLAAAREIAEAELDLRRVRRAVVAASRIREQTTTTALFEAAIERTKPDYDIAELVRILTRAKDHPKYRERLTASVTRTTRAEKLDAIDRYELRALSRRRTAIRRFDVVRAQLECE